MIDYMQVALTTHCNYNCPNCSWGINKISKSKRKHYTWEYLEDIAKIIYGLPKVCIIGGEPTTHPDFEDFSPKFKKLFGCEELLLWTNGYGFKSFPEAFKHYNWVIITRYTKDTFKNSLDNGKDIEFIFDYYMKKTTNPQIQKNRRGEIIALSGKGIPTITVGEVIHETPKEKQGINPCGRECTHSNVVAYLEGEIFPCCGALYLPETIGIKPGKNWKEEIIKVPIPCDKCLFAE